MGVLVRNHIDITTQQLTGEAVAWLVWRVL